MKGMVAKQIGRAGQISTEHLKTSIQHNNLTISIECREFDRCFGLDCFEKFFEKLR
jgi:hypothetical protein